jgi:hypothetical protein
MISEVATVTVGKARLTADTAAIDVIAVFHSEKTDGSLRHGLPRWT